MKVKFGDICFATHDVLRMRTFYELVFGVKGTGDEYNSGITLDGLTILFDNATMLQNVPSFKYASGQSSGNLFVDFNADDVDAEYERLISLGVKTLNEPITHPWGARSFQFRDPDGNILNFRSSSDKS